MRRQLVSSLGLTLLLASVAAAQQSSAVAPLAHISIGPFFGFNYTSFYGDKDLSPKSRTDFALGGQVDVTLATTTFLRTGLIYSRRGAKITELGFDLAFKPKYLELPVLFGYRFPTTSSAQPYLFGGPQLAVRVGCSVEVKQDDVSASADCDNPDLEADFHSVDFAAVAGFGMAVPLGTNSLSFDLRYALGFTKVVKEGNAKNRGLTLGVALMVPIGK